MIYDIGTAPMVKEICSAIGGESMLLSQYLISAGVVSPEKMLSALNAQQKKVEFFGSIAARLGYMNAFHVLEVLHYQAANGGRFGEIAIAMGYLTPAQVEEILDAQTRQRRCLSSTLIEEGLVDESTLKSAMNDYFNQVHNAAC